MNSELEIDIEEHEVFDLYKDYNKFTGIIYEKLYGEDAYYECESTIMHIKSSNNWNDINTQYLAYYLVTEDNITTLIKEKIQSLTEKNHNAVMKEVQKLLNKFEDYYNKDFAIKWYQLSDNEEMTIHEKVVTHYLGNYAKYFFSSDIRYKEMTKTEFREFCKKYLTTHEKYNNYFNRPIDILRMFFMFHQNSEVKDRLKTIYTITKNRNKHTPHKIKPTTITNKLRNDLINDLLETGIKKTKAKRLATTAVTALKKELF